MRGGRSALAIVRSIDLLIGASLLLALVGSAVGVWTYEDDRLAAFTLDWTTSDSTFELPALTFAGAGETQSDGIVGTYNLTEVAWIVTFAGNPARVQPVALRVEISVPLTNETIAQEATLPAGPVASVDVPLTFALAPVPDATRITGPSLDAARLAANATLGSSQGVGSWSIRVSVAPSAPGPLGAAETITATPRATLTWYEGDLTPETPEVSRG